MGDLFQFNSSRIKDYTKDLIIKKLQDIKGSKDLVLDTDLMTPLDRIIQPSALKETGVEKILRLEKPFGPIKGSPKRVYLMQNNTSLVQIMCAQVNIDLKAKIKCQYHLLMTPQLTCTCEMLMESEGVYGHITASSLPLLLIPLDHHLISLQIPLFYRAVFLDGDQTMLHHTASSLFLLQNLYGNFSKVTLIGQCAHKTYDLMTYMMEKASSPSSSTPSDHISQAIIIDRTLDLVTPLCSQVTYEGLLEEMFPIDCGFITLAPEVTNLQKPTKIFLSNQDLIFQEIRDRHFSNVSTFLSAKAKELQLAYDKRKGLNIAGTKDFIKNDLKILMSQHSSLSTHVGACDYITKKKTEGEIVKQLETEHSLLEGVDIKKCCAYIEEIISRQMSMQTSLCLMCLLSLTEGGLTSSLFRSLSTQFLQSYGYEHLVSLDNLKRVRMLCEKQAMSIFTKLNLPQQAFRNVARKLQLIPKSAKDINLKKPDDLSYVFSGAYRPLLCRVVEQVLSVNEVTQLEDALKMLDIPFSKKQNAEAAKGNVEVTKVVLVFVLGGITSSELSALKLLAKLKDCYIVVCTTSVINKNSFLAPFLK